MEMNTIIKEVWKTLSSKEGVKIMRDATAVSVAGSVVGIAIRNGLYSRSKKKGGWYAKYIDLPFNKKWCKADDKAVLASAVIATALDTILLLDRSGVIKLHSIEETSNDDPSNDIENDVEDIKQVILKHVDVGTSTINSCPEKTAETVPPSRDNIDDDEDDEDALY